MVWTTVKSSDVLVDRALEWDVYDPAGKLMHARGAVIDEETKRRMLKRGIMRKIDEETGTRLSQRPDKREGLTPSRPPEPPTEPVKGARMLLGDTTVRPGDTIHIDRSLDGSRVTARLIGYLKGKSIIITIPADDGGPVFPKEGEAVVAKLFAGKHVLAFTTSIMAISTKPYPHIHLSYPPEVTGIVVRRTERVGVRIIASMEYGKDTVAGIITDISMGGLSFATRDSQIPLGTELFVNFKILIEDCPYIMRIRCLVRGNRGGTPDVLEGSTGYGTQFRDLSAEDVLVLGLFIAQQSVSTKAAAS